MRIEKISIWRTCIALITIIYAYSIETQAQRIIHNFHIELTTRKTSSLVFPAVIKSVDRGSRDVLAQKALGVENVLHLKASRLPAQTTNLTVITSDGVMYEMTVSFTNTPPQLVYDFSATPNDTPDYPRLIFDTSMTEAELESNAKAIATARRTMHLSKRRYKVTLELLGIYIRDNISFMHVRIKNQSFINYDVQVIRFFIQDQVLLKRTSRQEIPITPIWVHGDQQVIKGKSSNVLVFALPKFTIPDAKKITWEVFEDHGGRNLQLDISNRRINKARPIPSVAPENKRQNSSHNQ